MEKMQYCAWCGKKLGIYEVFGRNPESCGRRECERAIDRMLAYDEEYEREERARWDRFERY